MEGVPQTEKNNESNIENLSEWREQKEQAQQDAVSRIAKISGYEGMIFEEKVAALTELLTQLAIEGNHNRFVAQEVARIREIIIENDRHETRMRQLGVAV